jgi:hypothetical protein
VNFKRTLVIIFLSLFSFGLAQAAGEPMNEDFSELVTLSEKMLDAGKSSDISGFNTAADDAMAIVKERGMKRGNSPKLQKVAPKFKAAKKAANSGDFQTGVKLVEEALAAMKK